jgi:hypothetical protein
MFKLHHEGLLRQLLRNPLVLEGLCSRTGLAQGSIDPSTICSHPGILHSAELAPTTMDNNFLISRIAQVIGITASALFAGLGFEFTLGTISAISKSLTPLL